jgi:serine/threonine protein kinase
MDPYYKVSDPQDEVTFGTPMYLSPEVLQNKSLSKENDLYAFGLILFEICTGEQPFRKSGGDLINQILNEPAPTPSRRMTPWPYSATLEALILNLLSKSPQSRCNAEEIKSVIQGDIDQALINQMDFDAESTLTQKSSFLRSLEETHDLNEDQFMDSPIPTVPEIHPTLQSARVHSTITATLSRHLKDTFSSSAWIQNALWMSMGIVTTLFVLWLMDLLR